MKAMHKLLAIVLALTLVLAMATTAFAAKEGGTIKVTGTNADIEYTVYQMFDISTTPDGGYKYSLTEEWNAFRADDYFTVTSTGYIMWIGEEGSHADAAAVAELAKAFVVTNNLQSDKKVSVSASLPVDADGYYLLVPNMLSPCGAIAVVGGEEREVTVKTEEKELPSLTKKVYEDSTQTFEFANDVDVGQEIRFHTTITAGSDASNYILHDKMDDHFTFGQVTEITRGGNVVNPSDYKVITEACGTYCPYYDETTGEGCTFHVEFTESFCRSLTKGAVIVVNYTAKLQATEPENLVDKDHENFTRLTHTNQHIPTDEAKTATRTYKITVNKVDQNKQPLAGAGFMLKDNVGNYYHLNKNGDVSWLTPAGTDENGKQIWKEGNTVTEKSPTEMVTPENGVIEFVGVDAEVFTLVESTIPNGYTGQVNTQVSTKAESKASEETRIASSKIVEVTNTLGTALPETGGMGTTMFYVVGGLLAAAAVVLLITKKRVSAK